MPPYNPKRDPYTYAADWLRQVVAADAERQTHLSRAEASRVRQAIAKELGIEDRALAEIFSRAYQREHRLEPDGSSR